MRTNLQQRCLAFSRALAEYFDRCEDFIDDACAISTLLQLHTAREEFKCAWEWRVCIVGDAKNNVEGFVHALEAMKQKLYGTLEPSQWNALKNAAQSLRDFVGGYDNRSRKINKTYLYEMIGRETAEYQWGLEENDSVYYSPREDVPLTRSEQLRIEWERDARNKMLRENYDRSLRS